MSTEPVSHPAKDQLVAFGLGKLEPAAALEVESHLAECESCCDTLVNLEEDTFVELVRSAPKRDEDQADSAAATALLDPAVRPDRDALPAELQEHPRYRVSALLGRGGMGAVYKAEHLLMNRIVALKVIDRELVQNSKAVERFQREVRAAAQLTHPNIVTAFDAEQAGEVHYLVMEFVDGIDMARKVRQEGPLDISLACDLVHQAACGLQHAHENGMVHRDIKPHNLMVTDSGQVKILDFGLATLAAAPESDDSDSGSQVEQAVQGLTLAGAMMGTPDFMSPEQADDARRADIRSDIYSLGCTLYYLLSGRTPFLAETVSQKLRALREESPPPLESLRENMPAELAEIVGKMMAKDPEDRFQTPQEVADALTPFAQNTTAEAPTVSYARDRPAPVGWRRFFAPQGIRVALIGLALAVLASVLVIVTDNGTLIITAHDPQARIRLLQSGEVVRTIEIREHVASNNSGEEQSEGTIRVRVNLQSGDYELETIGDSELHLSKRRVTIRRGGEDAVEIRRQLGEAKSENDETAPPPAAVAKQETQRQFNVLVAAARGATSEDDWKKVIASYTPALWPLPHEASQDLIELLAELPEEMHAELMQKGYLKWQMSSLDAERRNALISLMKGYDSIGAKVKAESSELPPDVRFQALEKLLADSEVGFAVLDVPETNKQVVAWYLLMNVEPTSFTVPTAVPLSGGSTQALMAVHTPAGRAQVAALKEKPFSELPPRPVADTELRVALHELLADKPAADASEDAWKAFLTEHVPFLSHAPKTTLQRGMIELVAGLPDTTREELLQQGYLKWRFNELTAERQEGYRSILRAIMSAVPQEHRSEEVVELLVNSLPGAEAGFVILRAPESQGQFAACYLKLPTSFSPMILPFVGDLQEFAKKGPMPSPETHPELEQLEVKPFSDLPQDSVESDAEVDRP